MRIEASGIQFSKSAVRVRCGFSGVLLIRLTENGWYNKSGKKYGGLYVEQSFVTARRWNATWIEEGYIVESGSLYYDCETRYFAVKVSWDKQ